MFCLASLSPLRHARHRIAAVDPVDLPGAEVKERLATCRIYTFVDHNCYLFAQHRPE
jgi:hypothetical protein